MSTKQYTIRAVPGRLDSFLRRQARLQGKSLNQTVLDYIEQATKLDLQQEEDDFSWIIGANTLDDDTQKALHEFKRMDKRTTRI